MRGYTEEAEYYFGSSFERHKQYQPTLIQPQEIAALIELDIPEDSENDSNKENNIEGKV